MDDDAAAQARQAGRAEARQKMEAILADPTSSPSLRCLARARLATNSIVGQNEPIQTFSKSIETFFQVPPNMPSFMKAVQEKWTANVIAYELIHSKTTTTAAIPNIQVQQTIVTNAAECLLVAAELCSMTIASGSMMPYLTAAVKAVIAKQAGSTPTLLAHAYFVYAYLFLHDYLQRRDSKVHQKLLNALRKSLLLAPKNPFLVHSAAAIYAVLQDQVSCLHNLYLARTLYKEARSQAKRKAKQEGIKGDTFLFDKGLIALHDSIGKILALDLDHKLSNDMNFDDAIKELTAAVQKTYAAAAAEQEQQKGSSSSAHASQHAGEQVLYRGDNVICEYVLCCVEHRRGHFSASRKWFYAAQEHEPLIGSSEKRVAAAESNHKFLAQAVMAEQMKNNLTTGKKSIGLSPACSFCKKEPASSGATLKCCTRCRSAHYCSVACQKSDWKKHKKKCKEIAAAGGGGGAAGAAGAATGNDKDGNTTSSTVKKTMRKEKKEALKGRTKMIDMQPIDLALTPETLWSKGLMLVKKEQ